MSNNTDFSDDPRVIFPSQSSENAVNPEEDRRAPNSAAENSSGDTSLTVEEVEFELDAMFGESYSQEFKERTQELLARAVLTATESIQVELASEYQDRINALERELALRECCQGMALTDRERFRAQTEHIQYDDSFKTKLLSEKRRQFPYASNYDPLNEEYYDPPESKPDPLHETAMRVLSDMSRWGR